MSVGDAAHCWVTPAFDTLYAAETSCSIYQGDQMESKKVNLWLDVILAAGLVMAMIPGITGRPMHQRIGIALGVGVVVHLLLHWKWIVAMSRSFTKLPGTVRFKLVLNSLSLLALSSAIVSGPMNAATLSGNVSAGAMIQRSGLTFRRDGLLPRQAGRELARPMLRHGDAGFHWHVIHHATALLSLFTVVLHLALHWRWIASATKRFMPESPSVRGIGS